MTLVRLVPLAVLLASVTANADAAEGNSLDPKLAFVRGDTWAATMLSTRANCAAWAKGAKEGQLVGTPLPAVWNKIQAAWPVQCAWFRQDLPSNRHLDWFLQSNLHFERWIMGLVLGRLGGNGAAVRGELDAMLRNRVAANDPQWLELYSRSRRLEEVLAAVERVWLIDLRADAQRQAAELMAAKVSADDPRWATLQRWIGKFATSGKAIRAGRIGDLRPAAQGLAASPGGSSRAGQLARQFASAEPRWRGVVEGAMRSEGPALAALPTLVEEIVAARRELLRSLPGMAEYLDRWQNVPLETEWEEQFATLSDDLANRPWFEKVAWQTLRPESLIQPADRDPADVVLRRTAALLDNLKPRSGDVSRSDAPQQLAALQKAGTTIDPADTESRYLLYAQACRLRRQIAFSNPLLQFNELLFVKRHRALYQHMCDQYYGIAARPGGGIYTLSAPFTPEAKLRDVLADAVVQRGRLQGQRLAGGPNKPWKISYDGMGNLKGDETEGGSFLSPDLSYDGRTLLFSYVECSGERNHFHHTDPARGHWSPGRSYHLFQVNLDGSGLVQLTDGTWNDFDPRWMPSGRIAFISERRGGYLRCGRVCPTYTLYDMATDGSGIRPLSCHETNEWHPCVAHDGRIAWTRWDYVDRHFSAAHMPWITGVDGRDPRPIHGNYAWRGNRPDMELSLRPIPGSPKYVATAAPHHGQAFGSLVIIDPRVQDDDGGSPLARLTPEVGFPETGDAGTETYGTAWPLSEDYHLAVYDGKTRVPPGRPGNPRPNYTQANDGIYLVDSFGNRELIYRDASISCHSPIPVMPRPRPPVITEPAERLAGQGRDEAAVAVVDVYESLKPWPAGTKITALRVWQLLPLSVAPAPRNTGVQVPGTGSINTGRALLGTVPVEADGSAQFFVPAGKEVFFQALDEKGLAVQSMRSGTQFLPGQRHTCQGCHEPKHRSPLPAGARLAMARAPSRLQPDVDGTNPFSYPRLVQPVLDKHCVACHAKERDKAPRLDAEPILVAGKAYMDLPTVYYASYASLAPKFGFYDYGQTDGRNKRTTPGEFGARASKLYEILARGHYDVKLSSDEMHRISVWLDACSMFYGVYEVAGGEAQLRREVVRPTLE